MSALEIVARVLVDGEVAGELWVDGSFLTQKIDPEDVDLVLRIHHMLLDGGSQKQRETVNWFASNLKAAHGCDSYVWAEYPADHPLYWNGVWMQSYWIRQFGFSRQDTGKGIAVVKLPDGVR
jgi:hypothetical protein